MYYNVLVKVLRVYVLACLNRKVKIHLKNKRENVRVCEDIVLCV